MRVTICAVGRLRKSPELDLVNDYLDRFGKAGRGNFSPEPLITASDHAASRGGELPLHAPRRKTGATDCRRLR